MKFKKIVCILKLEVNDDSQKMTKPVSFKVKSITHKSKTPEHLKNIGIKRTIGPFGFFNYCSTAVYKI